MNSPVHVDIAKAKAVAAKNIFMGSGLGEAAAGEGKGVLGPSGLGVSGFGPSAFALGSGVALRRGR
jgi:hypothetical protein